jgi:hypothetical protein
MESRRDAEVPVQDIAISDYAQLMSTGQVVMMATDWIPTESMPPVPQPDLEEYRRMEERMYGMTPHWATTTTTPRKQMPMDTKPDIPLR